MKKTKESERTHLCPDGEFHRWKSRVKDPKECPRCKQRLDKEKKK